jgi:hypothetical protein
MISAIDAEAFQAPRSLATGEGGRVNLLEAETPRPAVLPRTDFFPAAVKFWDLFWFP